MNLTDRDLDDLFRGAETGYRPKYKTKYFRDIELQLPIYKKSYLKQLFLICLLSLIPLGSMRYLIGESQIIFLNKPSKTKIELKRPKFTRAHAAVESNHGFVKDHSIGLNLVTSVEKAEEKAHPLEIKQALEGKITKPELYPLAIGFPTKQKEILTAKTNSKVSKFSANHFAISIHGGVEQSWITSENNSVNGILAIKAEYQKPIKNFNINFGVGLQLTKFDELKIEERTKIYDFSSSELEQSYKFGSMLSVIVPISVSYGLSKHDFEAGLRARANLMTTVFYKETLDNQTSKTSEGYTGVDLFNRFGVQPFLGYSYSINNKTSIGVNAGISLIKPTNSNRFKGEARNNPIEFNFYLKRSLNFDK